MGRVTFLGIDYGLKRIGIAKSDEAGVLAHGLGYISHTTDQEDLAEIKKLVDRHQIGRVVIGYPLNMNGSKGRKADEAERFCAHLKNALEIDVTLWDERLTTMEAERYLLSGDISRRKRRTKIDQLAAQIMLQSYMDAQQKGM